MRFHSRLLIIVASALLVGVANAEQWVRTYSGVGASIVLPAADGGYILGGGALIKVDPAGSIVWQHSLGAASVRPTGDGGYIAAGSINDQRDFDAWVVKLDSSGNIIWQAAYGGRGNDSATSVQPTVDNGYVVTGRTYSFGPGEQAWVFKVDSSGNLVWQRTYGDSGSEFAAAVVQTPDGGYLVAGGTDSYGENDFHLWLLRLDATGNIVWQKFYGGSGGEYAESVLGTADGGYVVAGGSYSLGGAGMHFWVIKVDAIGNLVWQKTYVGPGRSYAYGVSADPDGGYLVAGWAETVFGGNTHAALLKLDSSGDILWHRVYNGAGSHYARSIQRAADGDYIAGASGTNGTIVFKLDAEGAIDGCASIESLSATVKDTTATMQSTSTAPIVSAATRVTAAVQPTNPNAISSQQCYYGMPSGPVSVVEYHAASLDHYFITPIATEIQALDRGAFGGAWARTGQSFKAWPSATAGAVPVCRVFVSYPGGSSHFYSGFANECAAASTTPGAPLFLETPNLMYLQLASASGYCPAGTQPVYRVWSNRADSNHRFTTDAATRDQMIARGWLLEGSGPGFATMCAPQ